MKFDQARGLRLSMSWLHTWSGLVLGWLLFAIFVTGTLSFFRNEITFWMQPELHHADSAHVDLERAVAVLQQEAAGAAQWSITLPGPRNPTLGLGWQAPGKNDARTEHGQGGGRGVRLVLDPASGEKLVGRETAGGNFLYRFHFELYGMDRIWARWIVGIATMLMLVAIITGVIVHRNIFKDFFTFRPAKGKRSWLDAHNASSVLSLPFHFVITFSGLLLFGNMIFPSAMQRAYHGDTSAFMQEARGRMATSATPPPSGESAPLADLAPLVAVAETAWGGRPAGSLTITHPGDRRAVVEVRQARGMSLTGGRNSTQSLRFEGVSGRLLDAVPPPPPSIVQSISNVFMMLHRGLFASPVPRWLLFVAGIGGSLMIATGLAMWSAARGKDRAADGRIPFGQRLVEVLNVAGVAGLMIALGAYLWASRLIPADMPHRNDWEIRVFFYSWLLTFGYALVRRHKAAWVGELGCAGALIVLLPVLNACSGGRSLFASVGSGQWLLASFDLCALVIGGSLILAARKVALHTPKVRAAKCAHHKATPDADTLPAAVASFPSFAPVPAEESA
ncbi:iron-regulated membrane protein [Betaproteobacteria bacterium]|nr:iron-regulated membrane protein [Betaproteobacteria bacterium]GHU29180.1 iron-regulated membrane protein [Betaproteobacteria bacterium]